MSIAEECRASQSVSRGIHTSEGGPVGYRREAVLESSLAAYLSVFSRLNTDFRLIEPTRMLGRVMDGESLPHSPWRGGMPKHAINQPSTSYLNSMLSRSAAGLRLSDVECPAVGSPFRVCTFALNPRFSLVVFASIQTLHRSAQSQCQDGTLCILIATSFYKLRGVR
jgi:hypothetical protein